MCHPWLTCQHKPFNCLSASLGGANAHGFPSVSFEEFCSCRVVYHSPALCNEDFVQNLRLARCSAPSCDVRFVFSTLAFSFTLLLNVLVFIGELWRKLPATTESPRTASGLPCTLPCVCTSNNTTQPL